MPDREQMRAEAARVMNGDAEGIAYHGASTRSNLDEITPALAEAHPIANAHSIWEIVAHIKVGRQSALDRLKGLNQDADWWPAITESGPDAWKSLLRSLDEVGDRLLETIGGLSDSAGDKVLSAFRFLIHHELYHSGQIAILRKALGLPGRPG